MGHVVVKWIAENAEDLCLAIGTLVLSVGAGIRFGYPAGLMVFGFLVIAYGVWITGRR